MAEGTSPAGESFAGHVISAAGHAWNTLDMSLTGSLRRLFSDADRTVRDWNRKSITEHRVSIGMSAFARRGAQAVIAQAGPGAAFHLHQGKVEAYHADEEHNRPLGSGDIDPQLTRIDFAPGDRVLLISTAALEEMDNELVSGILGLEGEKILAELYHRIQHLRDVTVLFVQRPAAPAFEPEAAAEDEYVIGAEAVEPIAEHTVPEPPEAEHVEPNAPEPREETGGSFQPSLFIDDSNEDMVVAARRKLVSVTARARQAVAPIALADLPEPLRRAAGENPMTLLAAERRAHSALSAAAVGGYRLAGHGPASFDGATNDARRRHRRDSFTRSLSRGEPPPRPEPVLEDVPRADDLAEDFRARNSVAGPMAETIAVDNEASLQSGAPLVRLRPSMGGRWKGGGALSKRRHVPIAQQPPTWLVILVGLGILLTLVGFLVVPGMLEDQGEGKYASLISEAQRHIATARANPDPAAQRAEYREARALLLEARDTTASGPEAEPLIGEVAAALQLMDAVREPASVETVASLEQFGEKPVAAARLVVGGDHAYILDSASSQVIDISISTAERRVIFGEDREAGRGQPLAIAYGEAAGSASLLVIDANKALWAINAEGEARQLDFAAPKALTPTDLALYSGDLYVLDAAAAVIWRFVPTGSGYGAAPETALETPDLAAARRMFVDGEIVTSDADGTLHLFVNQLSLVLSEAGIDERLVEARQPNRFGKNGDIAIVDAPNDRIVVFRSDGAFDHQYRHKSFAGIAALSMHEGLGYVFAGGQLQRVQFDAQ